VTTAKGTTLDLCNPVDLQFISAFSAVIDTSYRLGLIEALLEGERAPAAHWAQAVGLTEKGATLLLDVLCSIDWVEHHSDQYAASQSLRTFNRFGRTIQRLETALWGGLGDWLRTGERLAMFEAMSSETLYTHAARPLAQMAQKPAQTLAAQLEFDRGRILDVGCGSGPWSLAIAEDNPHVTVTGLDKPAVVAEFLGHARERGLSDRVEALPGDVFDLDIAPHSYDMVLVGQVLRILSPEQAQALVRRMAEVIRPGGLMVIVDAIANDDRESRQRLAVYALHLAMRSVEGGVLSEATMTAWLDAAGLVAIRRISLGEGSPVNALLAKQPET
jgi:3-hydroxy-5-methyl-1-naphthoate 3-O-methyltransferase